MNKKGFTLVELLAVIVILAIIALIAMPRVSEMIETSREGSAKDSFYGFMHAAELSYTSQLQKNPKLKGEECTIANHVVVCVNGTEIKYNGKAPEAGTLVIDETGFAIGTRITYGKYRCSGNTDTKNPCKETTGVLAADLIRAKAGNEVVDRNNHPDRKVNGLYADTYEAGRYTYKGVNPDNYIELDGDVYRIVSIETDDTIKVIKQQSIGKMAWDKDRSIPANGYCSTTYCDVWGSKTTMLNSSGAVVSSMPREIGGSTLLELPSGEAYLNKYLNTTFYNSLSATLKSKISTYNFNVGPLKDTPDDTQKLPEDMAQESAYKWSGKIGLLNATDYTKATSNHLCNNSTGGVNSFLYESCYGGDADNNYLAYSSNFWLLNPVYNPSMPYANNTWYVYYDATAGKNQITKIESKETFDVRPVFYLNSEITLTGLGTEDDMYKIK